MHWWQQVSAGHLHLDGFESTFHNTHTNKNTIRLDGVFCWWREVPLIRTFLLSRESREAERSSAVRGMDVGKVSPEMVKTTSM